MARIVDKDEIARKMFIESESDDLKINTERNKTRTKLREEIDRLMIRKFNVQFINLSDIVRRSDSQVRAADFDPEKYEADRQLLESIRHRGVVTPIMVKEMISDDDDFDADVKYELIYGHRRTSACKVLGYTTIPAQIVDRRIDSEEVTMIENMGVRPLSSFERGREIDRYTARTGISAAEFARQNGFSPSHVSELISAYRNSGEVPEIQELYCDEKIPSRYVAALIKEYRKSDAESKKLLLENLPELSRRQIKALLDFCAIGGSPAAFLKSSGAMPVTADTSGGNEEPGIKGKDDTGGQNPADAIWDRLEKSRSFAKKTANLYGCLTKDVKSAAAFCRDANLKPNAIKLVLAGKKNGIGTDDKTLEVIRFVLGNPETEKIADRYFAAYEKVSERKTTLLKQLDGLDEDGMAIISGIFR